MQRVIEIEAISYKITLDDNYVCKIKTASNIIDILTIYGVDCTCRRERITHSRGACAPKRGLSLPPNIRHFAAGRRGSAASADDERPRGLNLVNKQAVLPFVPPAFPTNAPDRLIKPSEYLKTITAPCKRDDSAAEARPPPPPPVPAINVPPPPPQPPVISHQPLAAISSAELSAVKLRTPATKTLSAPPPARSVSLQCIPSAAELYKNVKTDLIEELKMSKDITGIKKMKVERARRESLQDKETFTEFTKRFTAENFVDQVSELPFIS